MTVAGLVGDDVWAQPTNMLPATTARATNDRKTDMETPLGAIRTGGRTLPTEAPDEANPVESGESASCQSRLNDY